MLVALAWIGAAALAADGVPPTFPALTLWSVDLPAQPAASPAATAHVVAVALQSGVVSGWRLADRHQAWTAKIAVGGPVSAVGEVFVVQVKDGVQALAASSGALLWRVEAADVSAPILAEGGWVLVATPERLIALRLSDGKQVWSTAVGRINRRPAVDGDRLYASTSDGRVLALDLASGNLKWEREVGDNPSQPFAVGGRVYVGGGRDFACLKAESGSQDWRFSIGAPVVGAAAVDESHVYVTSMDNLVRAMDRISGNVRWKADLGHRPDAGPTVVGATVIVPGRASLIRGFDAKTGRPAVQLTLPEPMVVQPTFFMGPGGRQMAAALTANLKGESRLTIAGSALPFIPLVPLTSLPGSASATPRR
jgi:outer membrane protein assembly factor BamB